MDITADTFGRLNQFGGCGQRFAKHAIGTLNQVVVCDRVPEQFQLPPALSGGDKPTSLRPLQTIKGRFVRQFDLVEGAKHSLQQEIIESREAESQRLAKRKASVSRSGKSAPREAGSQRQQRQEHDYGTSQEYIRPYTKLSNRLPWSAWNGTQFGGACVWPRFFDSRV